KLIDRCLECETNARQRYIGGFGAERVGFPIEFLRKKIKLASHRLSRGHQGSRLVHMRLQAIEFFANVGLDRQKRRLLSQAIFREAAARKHVLHLCQELSRRTRGWAASSALASPVRRATSSTCAASTARSLLPSEARARIKASSAVANVSTIAASRIALAGASMGSASS